MKLLFAPDSYKGSLSADEVCAILSAAAAECIPNVQCESLPIADGGEGTVSQPLLSFRAMQDHVVPLRNAQYILDHVNSRFKNVITLEHSYHCATIDYDRERIAVGIEQFITLVRTQQI
jgi:glycerate kinase